MRELNRYFVAPRGRLSLDCRLSLKRSTLDAKYFLYSLLCGVESVMVAVSMKRANVLPSKDRACRTWEG